MPTRFCMTVTLHVYRLRLTNVVASLWAKQAHRIKERIFLYKESLWHEQSTETCQRPRPCRSQLNPCLAKTWRPLRDTSRKSPATWNLHRRTMERELQTVEIAPALWEPVLLESRQLLLRLCLINISFPAKLILTRWCFAAVFPHFLSASKRAPPFA